MQAALTMTQCAAARLALIGSALMLFSFAAGANTIVTYATATGALNGTRPVSIEAIFDLGPDSIKITVTNLENNPVDVSQGLNALAFQPTGQGMTIIQPKLNSSSSAEIYINGDGTHSTPAPVATTSWALSTSSVAGGLPFQVCRLCNARPDQLLIGDWGAGGLYSAANGSIADNGPHNPFLYKTATFTITGINNATGISSVIFSFGTTTGQNVPGRPEDFNAPEPGAVVLISGGLLLLVAARFSRRLTRV